MRNMLVMGTLLLIWFLNGIFFFLDVGGVGDSIYLFHNTPNGDILCFLLT